VKIANGQRMVSDSQVLGLPWTVNNTTFTTDMRVLELGAYDAVLGMDWLKRFGTMTCNWAKKTLIFDYDNTPVTLIGMDMPVTDQLGQFTMVELQSWLQNNEVWAMAVVDTVYRQVDSELVHMSPDLQVLLTEFEDVFSDPKKLPPCRALDHAITLESAAPPVNARPYRYSPSQKDKLSAK
jgi:hypothetical protein